MVAAIVVVIVGTLLLVKLILRAERVLTDEDRRPSTRPLTGSLWLWEQEWRRSHMQD